VPNASNMSNPRIYIQNGSSMPLRKFTIHYFLTSDNNKTPKMKEYWAPGATVSLNKINNSLYEVLFYYSGMLDTGNAILPAPAGSVVGLYYADWSSLDKSNDFSNNNSPIFLKNENIVVTDSNGVIIYGELPGTGTPPGSGPDIPPEPGTAISGTGNYSVTTTGVMYRYTNAGFHHGMMFTIRNLGLNDSVTVQWHGVLDQNNSNCQFRTANLFGNGAQINNICTPKNDSNSMFVTLRSKSNCSVRIEIFDWLNGLGCR